MADPDIRCVCQHKPADHSRRTGRCRERDGYSIRCLCPSFELEDLRWVEPDPDDVREQAVDELLRARP